MARKKLTPEMELVEKIAMLMMANKERAMDESEIVPEAVILKILSAVENLEAVDRDGRTLLINAAFYGREASLCYLLERGANIHAADQNGFTALHAAVHESRLEIVKYLLEKGADPNARDAFGNTPLQRLGHTQPKEFYLLLLTHGADPDIPNNSGISARDKNAAYPEILELMNTCGAQPK